MSGTTETETDPALHINLKVNCQGGREVLYKIKRTTHLHKLMRAYCERQSLDYHSVAFLYEGRRFRGSQTPDELDMDDGDEIDVMIHQFGGYSPYFYA